MNFDDYQQAARRTANTGETDLRLRLANWSLGLGGETGELQEQIKKMLFHGIEVVEQVVVSEMGDVLWYLAILANELGIDLNRVAEANVAKLSARYPDGFKVGRKPDGR